jgi:diaminohydroxyphosphoribosylaminopyrimidine deaminase/5-amino-6-(5-phosphoribosylamino)uracil reductase
MAGKVSTPDFTADAAEALMRRAITLSENGPARDLNPQVGAVLLNASGDVIAEGWHRGAGTPHAEIDALSQVTPEQARGGTLVVTLEPCNHTGRTGPCALAVVDAGIARLVYAATDPGHASSGGADRLRAAGVEVISGVLEHDVTEHQHSWLTAARLGRPHVTLKWAMTLDGRAAAADGTSQWISGSVARALVHEQRAAAEAIAVGTGTVLDDNPSLTARAESGELRAHQPIPVIFGERPLTSDATIFTHPQTPVVLGHRDIARGLNELHERGIRSLYVEGGPTLASAFVAAGMVDRFYVFISPLLLGGPRLALGDLGVSTLAERIDLDIQNVTHLGSDLLIEATPRKDA